MATKRYRVVAEDTKVLVQAGGKSAVYALGDEYEFDYSEEAGYNEEAVLASGAIEEVTGDEPKEKAKEPTKQELLDFTAEHAISSDDSMTKAELHKAIADWEAQQGS